LKGVKTQDGFGNCGLCCGLFIANFSTLPYLFRPNIAQKHHGGSFLTTIPWPLTPATGVRVPLGSPSKISYLLTVVPNALKVNALSRRFLFLGVGNAVSFHPSFQYSIFQP
jgi:hypothetical protein